ncbi:MAG: hypothetical protein ABIK07_02310 [Planctomycetota bacterium]
MLIAIGKTVHFMFAKPSGFLIGSIPWSEIVPMIPATQPALIMAGTGDGGEIAIDKESEPFTQREPGCVFAFRTVNQLSVIL